MEPDIASPGSPPPTETTLLDLPDELLSHILSFLAPPTRSPSEIEFATSASRFPSTSTSALPPPTLYSFQSDAMITLHVEEGTARGSNGLAEVARVAQTCSRMFRVSVPLLYSDVVLRSLPVNLQRQSMKIGQRKANDWEVSHVKTSFYPGLTRQGDRDNHLSYASHVRSLTLVVQDNFCCEHCLRQSLKDVFGLLGEAHAKARAMGTSRDMRGLNRLRLICPVLDPSAVPVVTPELVRLLIRGSASEDEDSQGIAGKPIGTDALTTSTVSGVMSDEDFDKWLLEGNDDIDSVDDGVDPTLDAENASDFLSRTATDLETEVDGSVGLPSSSVANPHSLAHSAPPITHLLIAGGWRYPDPALTDLLSSVAPTLQQLVLPNVIPGPMNPVNFASLQVAFPVLSSLSLVLPNSTSLSAPLLLSVPHLLSLCPSLTTLRIKHRTPKRSMLPHVTIPAGQWGSWTEDTFPSPEWLKRKGMVERVDIGKSLLSAVCAKGIEKFELELPSLDGGLVAMLLGVSPEVLAVLESREDSAEKVEVLETELLFPRLSSLLLSGGGPGSSVGLSSRSIRTLCSHVRLARQLKRFVMVNLDIDVSALPHIRDGLVNVDRVELWCVGGFRLWHFGAFADRPVDPWRSRTRQLIMRTELQPADGNRHNFERVATRLEAAGWEFEVVVGKNNDPVAVLG